MKNIYVILFVLLFNYCNTKQETSINETFVFPNKYGLNFNKSFSLLLDSLTYTGSSCFQYIDFYNKKQIVYNNPKTNALYFHNIENGKLLKKVPFVREGSEGIANIDGFYIHTPDSIFIPSTLSQAMFLVNENGNIIQKYKYLKERKDDIMQIDFTVFNHPVLHNGKLYCVSVYENKNKDRTMLQTLDLNTKKWTPSIYFPDEYKNNFYPSPGFYAPYATFNDKNKRLYFSMPVSNYIYETDFIKTYNKTYAGAKNLKEIKPFSNNVFNLLFSEREKYFQENLSYSAVFYDKYRDIYYRIALHPIDKVYMNSKDEFKKYFKNFSIIILDKNMNKVGEIMPEKYTYAQRIIIPIPEGILLKNFKKSKENEDMDYFDLFEVVENKK